MCLCLFPVVKIREAKTICQTLPFYGSERLLNSLITYIWGRQKSNSIVEWWHNSVGNFCVYLASHFPQTAPAVSINSTKSHSGFSISHNPFTSYCNVIQCVAIFSLTCLHLLLFYHNRFLWLLWGWRYSRLSVGVSHFKITAVFFN